MAGEWLGVGSVRPDKAASRRGAGRGARCSVEPGGRAVSSWWESGAGQGGAASLRRPADSAASCRRPQGTRGVRGSPCSLQGGLTGLQSSVFSLLALLKGLLLGSRGDERRSFSFCCCAESVVGILRLRGSIYTLCGLSSDVTHAQPISVRKKTRAWQH